MPLVLTENATPQARNNAGGNWVTVPHEIVKKCLVVRYNNNLQWLCSPEISNHFDSTTKISAGCRPAYLYNSLQHDYTTISAGYSNNYFQQESKSMFCCIPNVKLDNKGNKKLTNMNMKQR